MGIITILDRNFKKIDILREYEYLQYTSPVRDIGKFTLNAKISDATKLFISAGEMEYFYLMFEKDYIARVERIEQSDEETGPDTVTITGRNCLFILTKRVIQGTLEFNGATAQYIKALIEANITNEGLGKRRINAVVILDDEEYLLTQCSTINKQVTGGYVWDEVSDALEQDKLGIYMIPILQDVSEEEDYNVDHWEIHITAGVNRTRGNYLNNPVVTFSQSLSNIARTTYSKDVSNYGSMYYVAGEGEGEDRKWFEIYNKEEEELASGWDRSEIWVDARDIQSTIDGGDTELTDEDYEALITNRAGEKMKEHRESISYEATITQESRPYVYGKDYNKSDFVTVIDNKLGIEVEAQIIGITITWQGARVIRDINFLYGSVKGDPIRQIQQNNQNTGDNTVNIKYVENKVLSIDKTIKSRFGAIKAMAAGTIVRNEPNTTTEPWAFTKGQVRSILSEQCGITVPSNSGGSGDAVVLMANGDGDAQGSQMYAAKYKESAGGSWISPFNNAVSSGIRINYLILYFGEILSTS